MTAPRGLAVLGATGSIGRQTLELVSGPLAERFEVVGLAAAGGRPEALAEAGRRAGARRLVASGHEEGRQVRDAAGSMPVRSGREALLELATDPDVDIVVVGIAGTAALEPAHAALRAGKTLALANKESLVAGGGLMLAAAEEGGGRILPVDSEHNALFRLLEGRDPDAVERVVLTASGGAFLHRDPESLAQVTPEEAMRHPAWKMGPLVTVNSATLMNKGLEVVEAMWLFGLPPDRVEAVIHPQAAVHGMVRWTDGTAALFAAPPDMRHAIQHALCWPEAPPAGLPPLDLGQAGEWRFLPLDPARWPCYALARQAAATGGGAPAVLNAANEVAVAAFLEGGMRFTRIPEVVERTLEAISSAAPATVGEVLALDNEARRVAARIASA